MEQVEGASVSTRIETPPSKKERRLHAYYWCHRNCPKRTRRELLPDLLAKAAGPGRKDPLKKDPSAFSINAIILGSDRGPGKRIFA
jgi:hypothetical protein